MIKKVFFCFSYICPFCKTFTPPLIILFNRMILWQIKRYCFNFFHFITFSLLSPPTSLNFYRTSIGFPVPSTFVYIIAYYLFINVVFVYKDLPHFPNLNKELRKSVRDRWKLLINQE